MSAGGQLVALSGERQPEFGYQVFEVRQSELGAEPGDRLELVQGSARVADAAFGDDGNRQPAGRGDRRGDQRYFVADAAGRVVVHLGFGHCGEVDALPAAEHRRRQRGGFGVVESVARAGHQKGGHLRIGNFRADISVDQPFELFESEFFAIALAADQIYNSVHKWYIPLEITLETGNFSAERKTFSLARSGS